MITYFSFFYFAILEKRDKKCKFTHSHIYIAALHFEKVGVVKGEVIFKMYRSGYVARIMLHVKKSLTESRIRKRFSESAILKDKTKIHFVPDSDHVQNSQNYKIAIMGGGISGQVSAYYARKAFPYSEITLFEKSSKAGGWMETVHTDQFVHELGPRSIRKNAMAVEILNICDEIEIIDRVIKDNPKSMKINLIKNNELHTRKLYKSILILRFLMIKLKYKLSTKIQRNTKENDLTVSQFFEQFMSPDHRFINEEIDPFLSGIWAGKISELSAKSSLNLMLTFLKDPRISTFPTPKPQSKRVKRYLNYLKGSTAFAFKAGFYELIDRLTTLLLFNKVDIKYD